MSAPKGFYISNFRRIPTLHESSQEHTLEWVARAHQKTLDSTFSDPARFQKLLMRVACKPDRIQKRGHDLEDFLHFDWEKMRIFKLNEAPAGLGIGPRTDVFQESAVRVFKEFYPPEATSPEHLIHVTCTGYTSPSAAQLLVEERNWGKKTIVSHAYHMGCYAAIPALRLSAGQPTDIVHTETCSLHFNPSLHDPEQLVVQSLFADGFIKYAVSPNPLERGFKVLALSEEIVPGTQDLMTWAPKEFGMSMTLSALVPRSIQGALGGFLERLFAYAGRNYRNERAAAVFAVHPGGPKIIDSVQQQLELSAEQVAASQAVLFEHGNMSSATLPHIWKKLLEEQNPARGQLVASLAFGPGLTIAGALFERT